MSSGQFRYEGPTVWLVTGEKKKTLVGLLIKVLHAFAVAATLLALSMTWSSPLKRFFFFHKIKTYRTK